MKKALTLLIALATLALATTADAKVNKQSSRQEAASKRFDRPIIVSPRTMDIPMPFWPWMRGIPGADSPAWFKFMPRILRVEQGRPTRPPR